jgi:hypothetical protein
MRRKMKLDVEALTVETFVAGDAGRLGTVRAHESGATDCPETGPVFICTYNEACLGTMDCDTQQTNCGGNTCEGSCTQCDAGSCRGQTYCQYSCIYRECNPSVEPHCLG